MTKKKANHILGTLAAVLVLFLAWLIVTDGRSGAAGAADYIEGAVTSSNGAEAGVWVIAETTDLPTRFIKIVVTDGQGRYVLPELPQANYHVFVRGYGLVDSAHVAAKPGQHLSAWSCDGSAGRKIPDPDCCGSRSYPTEEIVLPRAHLNEPSSN